MERLTSKQLKEKIKFIDKYLKAQNAASGSQLDANANVSSKNIATLSAELCKDIYLQVNRELVANKIEKRFGDELAKEYIRQIEDHEIYVHDETSIMPYTYGASEAILVTKNGQERLTTFELLYDLYPDLDEVLLDEEKGVWAKYPNDLFVHDVNGLTRVTRLVKKNRHRDIVRVKTECGEDLLVTDNHPMIVEKGNIDNTIPAIDSCGQTQFKKDIKFSFNKTHINTIEEFDGLESYDSYLISKENNGTKIEGMLPFIPLNEDLGYAVGFFIAEGSYTADGITITQNDPAILKEVASCIYSSTGIVGKIYEDASASHENRNTKYVLNYSSRFLKRLLLEYFDIPAYAQRKTLPGNIYRTNASFVDGLMSGLIDGDGSVGNIISIRVASRALISQMSILLRSFDFGISTSYQEQDTQAFGSFSSNYPVFGISFGLTGKLKFNKSHKVNSLRNQITTSTRYKADETKILSVTKIVNEKYLNNSIYDITTESHQFLCNNIMVHNCVSITMFPFLANGLQDLGGESKAPKHLASFCGSFVNLVFAISSQFAGAVATTEFLMYFDYFARKDYGKNYLETHRKIIENELQHVIYAINQPAAARGYQSAFWNISIFDKNYFDAMFGHFYFLDGDQPSWDSLDRLQKFFMKWFNKERTKSLLTFPVVTAAMLAKDNEPADKEFGQFCAGELAEGNAFFVYMGDTVDSLSSCCRLRNEFETNEFSYTLGAGGVATGSINVITMNINRLIQDQVKGKRNLAEEIEKIQKYQVAYRDLMQDYLDANMLSVYTAGFINMSKQFLTIGINGIVEAAEFLGIKPNKNDEYKKFLQDTLKVFYDKNKEARKIYGHKFNTEFVPAENLGVKFAMWDKEAGYFSPRECYNSYFYPVEDGTINHLDKFSLYGRDIIQYLDGGSALHLNLEEYLTKDGFYNLLKVMATTGCNYLGTNVKVTICDKCNHIDKYTRSSCPRCGSNEVGHATRVIGYLKRIDNFSAARQTEARARYYHSEKSGLVAIKDWESKT